MFRNYLAAALRNLVRNRLYAAINIGGLAIGFAAAVLIALFVRDELSFDTWIPDHRNVYAIGTTISVPGAPPLSAIMSDFQDKENLALDFPEMTHIARVWTQEHGLRHGDVEAAEQIAWTDPSVFAVLGLSLRAGDPSTALEGADTVVLSRAMARKYFSREDVVGETIELDRKTLLRVTGILDDVPARSHLEIDVLASGKSVFEGPNQRRGLGARTYVRLKAGTDPSSLEQRFPDWIDRHYASLFGNSGGPPPPGVKKISDMRSHWLIPVAALHLKTPSNAPAAMRGGAGVFRTVGNPALVTALSAIGGLILFVAAANFVNLMTARAGRRAVEVGVRKAVGGSRPHLLVQFLGEAAASVGVALVIALALVGAILPSFNAFLDRQIAVEPWRDLSLPLLLAGLVLGLTLLGGFYPAFILARWRPAAALKGGTPIPQRSDWLRQSLVVGQFAILVALIVATIVISRQTLFAAKANLRSDMAQILVAEAPCTDRLTNTLNAIAGVRGVACAGGTLVGAGRGGSVQVSMLTSGRSVSYEHAYVDVGLLELMGIKPIAGRLFDDRGSALDQYVINESAVREFGYESPSDALGKRFAYPNGTTGAEVIGVVEDFPIRSLEVPIGPIAFQRDKTYDFLAIKLDGDRIGTARPAIENELRALGPTKPISTYFYDSYVERIYRDLVRQGQAFTAFAAVAVFIAGLGLFGLAAFTAERRTKEIGIRKAMGARTADVLRLLLWQFTRPVLWANLIAWPVAYIVMKRWLESFAAHIELEAWVFVAAGGAAVAIAVATVIGHTLLVARAKPVTALRYE